MFKTHYGLLGLMFLTSTASAVDFESRTRFELEGAQNVAEGYAQKLEFQIRPELHWFMEDNSEITVIGRARWDLEDRLEPGAPIQDEISQWDRRYTMGNHGDAELRELYYKRRFEQSYLTIGKQQVVWGTADGLRVLDVVNPFSFREFLLEDFDEARIPIWMVNYIHSINYTTDLQFLFIPDQTFNDFPDGDGAAIPEYQITTPRFNPAIPSGIAGVNVEGLKRPSTSLANADIGLRLATRLNTVDFTLNYLYQYDDIPVSYRRIDSSSGQPILDLWQEYERIHILGSTLSTDLSSTVVLRYELGLIHDRRILTESITTNDGILTTDELSYVLGLDWSGISDTLLSMQLFQSVLADDAPDLVRDKTDSTLTFAVNRRFLHDTLTVDFLVLHNLNDHDELYQAEIQYALYDGINIWLGADVFSGHKNGLLGQFNNTDRIIAGVEWYW